MSSTDAAELRRQKILRNSQRRLELLMGVKNSEPALLIKDSHNEIDLNKNNNNNFLNETTEDSKQETSRPKHITNHQNELPSLIQNNPSSSSLFDPIENDIDSIINPGESVQVDQKNQTDSICKFNGYSNKEILIFFLISLATSLLFLFEQADYISKNVLVPFFTFEIAHLVVHFKHLPSTSSQFQLFRTLLQLCGVSQKSLKKLMIVFNFLFILIDNFVIYILSTVLINLLFKLVF